MSSSASSRRTAAPRPRRCSTGSRSSRAARSPTRAASSTRWTSTPSWRGGPSSSCVDELAHTNAPGSRHPKRYLDVEELLAAGIDVYTTVNIQHVESLNDVVAQITRVRVRETVPDSIIDRADEIELIDLTPDDLIQSARRKERSMFRRPPSAALDHYFSRGNLTALRELALRRTAQRVDEQLLHAHAGARYPPGPGRRASASLSASARIRRAPASSASRKRLADRLHAPWTALYVETPRSARSAKRSATASPKLCALPSGSAARPSAARARRRSPTTSWTCAQDNNVTADHHRQVGAPALVRAPARIGRARSRPPRRHDQRSRHRRRRHRSDAGGEQAAGIADRTDRGNALAYAIAVLSAAIALGVGIARAAATSMSRTCDSSSSPASSASRCASGSCRRSSRRSRLRSAYNFFFLPPLYTFSIAEPTNVAALVFFPSSPSSSRTWRRGVRRQALDGARPRCGRRKRSTRSAASSPASARSTTCCGRPPTRSLRC